MSRALPLLFIITACEPAWKQPTDDGCFAATVTEFHYGAYCWEVGENAYFESAVLCFPALQTEDGDVMCEIADTLAVEPMGDSPDAWRLCAYDDPTADEAQVLSVVICDPDLPPVP